MRNILQIIAYHRTVTGLSESILCNNFYSQILPFTALETEPVKGQWFHISDTHVQAVSASKVLSSQAYLLFYERLL